ncbi:MAG: oligosaccharide flippase family protein [Candidatus Bathyarchaeia archaeon]|jgi:stage V sporulation protein B
MEKAFEIGKTSATGSFQLLIGVATSTIIMAAGALILGKLLTSDELGLYGIVLVPSTLINLVRDWGINSAMTKYIATFRASGKDEEIHDIIIAGLTFEVASGLALSFLSLLLASFIATFAFHRPESASYIAIVSASIISGALLAASQSVFVGFERMKLYSFTQICQSIVKTLVSLTLVILGYAVLGAVIGYTLGFVAAAVIGLAIFYFFLFRPLRKRATGNSNITKTLRTMLNYGVPLSIASILGGVLAQIYSFMIIPLTTNAMYGNYTIALYFTVLLTFVTAPIATVLFPAFAKLDRQSEHELLKNVFASSVKYASILLVPFTMVIMVLSGPIIGTLYGGKYPSAPLFLTLYVISNLFVIFGSLSSSSFLSGLGETNILMIQSIATLVIGIPLGIVLISMLGITGLIIATVVSGVPSMIWGLYWIWKHYQAKADFKSSAKILTASAIAAILAYLPTVFLNTAYWTKLVIGLLIFLAAYIFGAPIIGAVSLTDITNLRTMFSGMTTISKIMNIPLKAAEKAAGIKPSNKKTDEKP